MNHCHKTFYHGNLLPIHNNYQGEIALWHRMTILPGMAVNYNGKCFITLGPGVKNCTWCDTQHTYCVYWIYWLSVVMLWRQKIVLILLFIIVITYWLNHQYDSNLFNTFSNILSKVEISPVAKVIKLFTTVSYEFY
jgi:hypothetical protein